MSSTAFVPYIDECALCSDRPGTREACKHLRQSRPCPEGLGIDVFGTVRSIGFPIAVLIDYDQPMSRYAFLLVE